MKQLDQKKDEFIFTPSRNTEITHLDTTSGRILIEPPVSIEKGKAYKVVLLSNQVIDIYVAKQVCSDCNDIEWELLAEGEKGYLQ